ncbi:hypothetical protein SAMN05216337_1017147 [Bradyrhizobium brasilense]|uniref:Uncharacterized protein n=1 Tax=Bradyrhizobium brasilense TaxID=1419277 RepID=A0A1G6YYX5_9BRAD|nr:hypothetical protein [Bradyrhizobium brasilense]SDD95511.1 hypothetical protein SAMN05216337_1017147 [Bradyrhizobium brasilense]
MIEAKRHHCGQMARILRIEHQQAVARLGINAHRELVARFSESAFRRACLRDGRLIALWGVTGSALASAGYVWLAMSVEATRLPLAAVRETRRQLDEIMVLKRTLVTSILDGDAAAMRFAVFLGFVPADEPGALPAVSRDGRRDLARRSERSEGARLPIGSGSAVTMSYQHAEGM